ncbi:Spy/CpxP family protein refolding chaperone [Vibrio agarilyticus]|uniref:Spy/CpxP family protein refolding chaperone n=1 Tax=Vibrio agarilyticus TaxID=2726741 RepID=UPI001B3B1ED6|nr:hypothetical protein [Vibrio agarilyticus]
MKLKSVLTLLFMLLSYLPTFANASESKYLGQEHRDIKSLSQHDIEELNRGGGWGLAKAAELNGVPGPAHILEMGSEIGLTSDQENKIQVIYDNMKIEAIELGKQLINLEKILNNGFSNKTINQSLLENTVQDIEKVRAKLRVIHLSTHLQTPSILTTEQIKRYNELRGYSNDPCKNIPEGHNPEMWKKHNGCSDQ